ncbi:hypothetical protein DFQ01_110131 [Paenibacillus cellulosilyticus]|uniref:Uncharacterized protein n=1 Tax=Paenibacillus cellulosilyticus TaxID=375489 RepID=A0A2V2YT94_9BACL|nr:hypothetical protein DFQ01_110131 [Paenibacillus cellulosilyticus]
MFFLKRINSAIVSYFSSQACYLPSLFAKQNYTRLSASTFRLSNSQFTLTKFPGHGGSSYPFECRTVNQTKEGMKVVRIYYYRGRFRSHGSSAVLPHQQRSQGRN